jgi:hypothetical protein
LNDLNCLNDLNRGFYPGLFIVQSPMSKPLQSRPIESCLEENGELPRRRNHRAEMRELPSSERVGATAYSRVRSLRGLLIGKTLCIAIRWSMNNAGYFSAPLG